MAVLCQKKPKAIRPKLKAYVLIALLLSPNFGAMAQGVRAKNLSPQLETKSLRVGDKLPEAFWQQEHTMYANGQTTKQTLAPYKGKLLILDFWATWCGSCIKKFPLSDSLEKTEPNVKVIMINTTATKDTPEKISATMRNYGPNLQTLVNDTLLTQFFPQVQLPHYVWIENGQVRAITGSEFFNRANVLNALHRRQQLNETIQKRNAKKP